MASKELEALNVLYKIALDTNYLFQKKDKETDNYKKRVEFHKTTVEDALKQREELAQALSIVTCENGDLLKHKKALEIIKNKRVDVSYLLCVFENDSKCKNYEGLHAYNSFAYHIDLTEEEYELLKGVLL